jgi:hypothetical protein
MIPIASTQVGGQLGAGVTPLNAFGLVANRINMLKPNVLDTVGNSFSQTAIPANFINQWEPGDPSQIPFPGPWTGPYTGPDFVTFGSPVAAPDGTMTAYPIVEVHDDTVPAYAAKPAPWALTGFSPTWNDFWNHCVCCVPCWEGTGSPRYYTAGGVLATPMLTQVGSPTWGTVDGSSLHFPNGSNDWRVEPVAGVDIFPTTHGTFLMVRQLHEAVPVPPNAAFGILATDAGGLLFWYPYAGTATAGWGNVAFVSATWPDTTVIQIIALVIGTSGITVYQRLATSPMQAVQMGHSATVTTRTAGNYQFGLAQGYNSAATVSQDVSFFAALNEEWTASQVELWANDPYAPIRPDGGSSVMHTGQASPHFVVAGCPYANRPHITGGFAIRHEFQCYAKAGTRSRFKLELSNIAATGLRSRQAGVTTIFDLVGGQVAIAPAAFGSGTIDGELVQWTPGPATITPVTGVTGWYLCKLQVLSNVSSSAATGEGVVCIITTDAGSGLTAENTEFPAAGGDTIYLWQTRLLPQGAFELNNLQFFDDFDSLGTIDLTYSLTPGFNWYIANHWPSSMNYSGYNPPNPPPHTPASDFSVTGSVLSFVGPGDSAGLLQIGIVSFYWDGTGSPDTTGQYSLSSAKGNLFRPPMLAEIKSKWPNVPSSPALGPPVFWAVDVKSYLQLNWFNPDTPDAMHNLGPTGGLITNAPTAAGSNVLHFASVTMPFRKPGMLVFDDAGVIPDITRVTSFTSTTITLNKNVTGAGVASGAEIHLSWYSELDFYENTGWADTSTGTAHHPYTTMQDLNGFWNETVPSGPSNASGDAFHLYQTLWLPVSANQHGLIVMFRDGMYWDQSSTPGSVMPYDLTLKADGAGQRLGAFTVADDPSAHYVILCGGGGDMWTHQVDHIAIYGA